MKHLYAYYIVFLLITYSSCGQALTNDKSQNSSNLTNRDSSEIYQSITNEICTCTLATMKNNKPLTTMDSCYKIVITKYTDTLRKWGYDPATTNGSNKLVKAIMANRCLSELLRKESENEDAKKLLFKGKIISQKQLPNGEIEIVMADTKTKEKRIFKSSSFLSDPSSSNKNVLDYEMTIEYEIKQNSTTKQDEYYIKNPQKGTGIIIETIKTGN